MLGGSAKTISPFRWRLGDGGQTEIAAALAAAGVDVTSVANATEGSGDVTLADFKDFGAYSAVSFASLGASSPRYGVLVATGVEADAAAGAAHLADRIAGRLAVSGDGFLITPAWVSRYAGHMDGTIVYAAAGHGGHGDSMAEAFLRNGAGAYLSYDDAVGTPFAASTGLAGFRHLLAGGAVGTIPGLGTSDSRAPHATFTLFTPDRASRLRGGTGIDDLFIEYKWPQTVRDLDTGTTFLGSGVGYAGPNNSPYLEWSGDDVTAGGTETIRVKLKAAHDAGRWAGTTTIRLAAGWYLPAGGSGPALVSVGLRDPRTGRLKYVVQRTISPGSQSGFATTLVGTVTITVTGPAGAETTRFSFA
jgi:hypothetical protein